MKNSSVSRVSARLARAHGLEVVPFFPTPAPTPSRQRRARNVPRGVNRTRLYRALRTARRLFGHDPAWIGEAYRASTGRWPRGLRTGEGLR